MALGMGNKTVVLLERYGRRQTWSVNRSLVPRAGGFNVALGRMDIPWSLVIEIRKGVGVGSALLAAEAQPHWPYRGRQLCELQPR